MLKRTKIAITGAVAAGTIAAAGIAYAAFGYSPVAEATGKADTFKPVTVTVDGATTTMLPGEKANVALKLTNPGDNTVKADVVSITGTGVEVLQSSLAGNTPADKTYCESMVKQNVNPGAVNAIPLLGAGTYDFTLVGGVEFLEAMDIRCQGMSYTTKWKVEFKAVRS